MVMGLYSMMQGSGPEQISYDKFLSLIDEGDVQEVSLNSDRIYITLTDEARQEEYQETGRTGNPGNVWSQLQDQMQSGSSTEEESQRDPDYYTGYVNDYTLVDKLEKAGVEFGSKPADTMGQTLLELFLTVILPIGYTYIYLADAEDDQRRRRDGHWQEQCQDVYGERDRRHIPGCGR